MASESNYGMTVVEAIDTVKERVEDILDGEWDIKSIWKLLGAMIQEAEKIYGAGRGKEKHELVREVWLQLDERYKILDRMDDIIRVPFWLEPFDKMLLKLLVDVLISGIVTLWNTFGWPR